MQIETEKKVQKDFSIWHIKKSLIDQRTIQHQFNQREIWWCSIGLNIGYEEDGRNSDFERPVLILRKFSPDVFIGLPFTSVAKKSPYYFNYSINENEPGSIILSYPRLLSSKRLNRKLSRISRGLFKQIYAEYIKLYS